MDAAERHGIYLAARDPGIYLNPKNSARYKKLWQEAHDRAVELVDKYERKEISLSLVFNQIDDEHNSIGEGGVSAETDSPCDPTSTDFQGGNPTGRD